MPGPVISRPVASTTRARRRPIRPAVGAAALALLLAGCGGAQGASDDDERMLVLASTDVYASLAEHVVDGAADVEAVVDEPALDPHSYEATPQDRLSVEEADVLIANGGGYDPFLTQLAAAAEKEDAVVQVIDGPNEHLHDDSEESGESESSGDSGGEDAHAGHEHGAAAGTLAANEHVWYDLPMMSDFVQDLAAELGERSPEHAEEFTQNAEELAAEIDAVDEEARAVDADGLQALATEPVSAHLLVRMGYEDVTDPDFLAAVEHGEDVSPRLQQRALDAASGGEIDLLAYNSQTETHQSERIRTAAEESDVPVMDFRETLPDDTDDYLVWMRDTVSSVRQLVEGDDA